MKAATTRPIVVVLLVGGVALLSGCETEAQTGMLIGAPIGLAVAVLGARGGGGAEDRGLAGMELGAIAGGTAGSIIDAEQRQ